jgi:hypothetical protein
MGPLFCGCGDEAAPVAPTAAWAEKVLACYQGALKETVAAFEGASAPEALPKLKAVKARYIELLVSLGREREAMDAAAKAQAQSTLLMRMIGIEKSEDYRKYNELVTGPHSVAKAKTDEEREAAAVVVSMNIITQYAHFELLKKQEPKEAERLGIQ